MSKRLARISGHPVTRVAPAIVVALRYSGSAVGRVLAGP